MLESEPLIAGSVETALTHMDALPVGTVLGEFELRGLLGVGGFGIVYRGYDHSLQRPVAIKEYLPSALVGRGANMQVSARSTADTQPFEAGLKSFIAEARLLAKFDHPSLVKVYRFWEANNTAYMAMPLYVGCTLKEARTQMSAPPPEEWLRTILWSVLEALKVLHANNTLHRDISPDNIFLQDQGPPVLLDLGAARRAIRDGNRKHTAILKINYAPIEQYADSADLREGPWTDLYAVAAVMHGCLRNEPPLPATVRAVKDTLPSFAKLAVTTASHFGVPYSAGFVRTIDHALMLAPNDRPASVEAFCVEMRLRRPAHIARFDWREALGVRLLHSSQANSEATRTTQSFATTQAPTEPGGLQSPQTTIVVPSAERTRSKRRRDKSSRANSSKSAAWVPPLLWAGVALAFAFAIFWGLSGRGKLAPTHQIQATRPMVEVEPKPLAAAASAPAVLIPVASEPAKPVNAATLTSPAPAAKPVVAPIKVVRSLPKPLPAVTSPPRPDVAVVHELPTKPVSDAKVESAANLKESASRSPSAAIHKELCPDSNFFTRPMCIYRECQKPENTKLAVCIEDRKRWENRDKTP
jgi:non-specific serine/threonine protein kinase